MAAFTPSGRGSFEFVAGDQRPGGKWNQCRLRRLGHGRQRRQAVRERRLGAGVGELFAETFGEVVSEPVDEDGDGAGVVGRCCPGLVGVVVGEWADDLLQGSGAVVEPGAVDGARCGADRLTIRASLDRSQCAEEGVVCSPTSADVVVGER